MAWQNTLCYISRKSMERKCFTTKYTLYCRISHFGIVWIKSVSKSLKFYILYLKCSFKVPGLKAPKTQTDFAMTTFHGFEETCSYHKPLGLSHYMILSLLLLWLASFPHNLDYSSEEQIEEPRRRHRDKEGANIKWKILHFISLSCTRCWWWAAPTDWCQIPSKKRSNIMPQ